MESCISSLEKTSTPPRAAAAEASTQNGGFLEGSERAVLQLPPEIWRHILSFFRLPFAALLTRQDPVLWTSPHYGDLARFALVNSAFAELIKPLLYERLHFILPKSDPSFQAETTRASPIKFRTKGHLTPFLRDLTVVGSRRNGVETKLLKNKLLLNYFDTLTHLKLCRLPQLQLGALSFPSLRVLTLMDSWPGVAMIVGRAPRLRHLGLLYGTGFPDSTPPLHQLCPLLVSLALGRKAFYTAIESPEGPRSQQLEGAAYIEATDRLFGPLCSTLRHLALDGHAKNVGAWEPLLHKCDSLLSLRIFNIREEWLPALRRLDLPSLSLLHLDALNPREAPEVEQEHATQVRDSLVESCLALAKEAIRNGRFAGLRIYVGGVTNDPDYPQRHSRIITDLRQGETCNPRVVDAFTRRDEWDPLGDEGRFELLGT